MDKKDIAVGWMRRFGLIHGFTMMLIYIAMLIINPQGTFGVSFLGNMILFSLAGTLPGLIYYSLRDMSEREWWVRTGIHFVLLNVLLLPIAHAIGLWDDTAGLLMFACIILVVDILVHVLSFGLDWVAARDINRMIQKRSGRN